MRTKQHFLQHREKHRNTKVTYTNVSKILPKEASIHTAKMTVVKETLNEIHYEKTKDG